MHLPDEHINPWNKDEYSGHYHQQVEDYEISIIPTDRIHKQSAIKQPKIRKFITPIVDSIRKCPVAIFSKPLVNRSNEFIQLEYFGRKYTQYKRSVPSHIVEKIQERRQIDIPFIDPVKIIYSLDSVKTLPPLKKEPIVKKQFLTRRPIFHKTPLKPQENEELADAEIHEIITPIKLQYNNRLENLKEVKGKVFKKKNEFSENFMDLEVPMIKSEFSHEEMEDMKLSLLNDLNYELPVAITSVGAGNRSRRREPFKVQELFSLYEKKSDDTKNSLLNDIKSEIKMEDASEEFWQSALKHKEHNRQNNMAQREMEAQDEKTTELLYSVSSANTSRHQPLTDFNIVEMCWNMFYHIKESGKPLDKDSADDLITIMESDNLDWNYVRCAIKERIQGLKPNAYLYFKALISHLKRIALVYEFEITESLASIFENIILQRPTRKSRHIYVSLQMKKMEVFNFPVNEEEERIRFDYDPDEKNEISELFDWNHITIESITKSLFLEEHVMSSQAMVLLVLLENYSVIFEWSPNDDDFEREFQEKMSTPM